MAAELDRELAPGHELYGVIAEPVANSGHCDSVIYALSGERFAIVHLIWARKAERPPWPATEVLAGWPQALDAMAAHASE